MPAGAASSIKCESPLATGLSLNGGYAEYMLLPGRQSCASPTSLARWMQPLCFALAGHLDALRTSGARGGDLVAVLGLGGLAICNPVCCQVRLQDNCHLAR